MATASPLKSEGPLSLIYVYATFNIEKKETTKVQVPIVIQFFTDRFDLFILFYKQLQSTSFVESYKLGILTSTIIQKSGKPKQFGFNIDDKQYAYV